MAGPTRNLVRNPALRTLMATWTTVSLGSSTHAVLVVVLFWDTHRIAALVVMTLVYLLVGVFALWRLSEHKKSDPPAFAATLAELERDRAFIASRFKESD